MTHIDFYVLPQTTLEARTDFACRLAETISRKGYRLHIHCANEEAAKAFDDALWTFRPESFLPHAILGEEDADVSITIGWDKPPEPGIEALLNLHPGVPEWFSRFERIAEIINQHQQVLNDKRECWQLYKHRGYPVKAHHLKA